MSKRCIFLLLLGAFALSSIPAGAVEIWSGRDLYFEKAAYADWTQPENQDRITDVVWITRQDTQGIFNIFSEGDYTDWYSPEDTEWATGDAVDYESLTFETWEDWNGSYPPGMVGIEACVHLVTDDIYIDIRFESWTSGGQGGGFAYYRAEEPASSANAGTWGQIKTLFK